MNTAGCLAILALEKTPHAQNREARYRVYTGGQMEIHVHPRTHTHHG